MKLQPSEINAKMGDRLFADAYGKSWAESRHATEFLYRYGYRKVAEIHHWEWSDTFGRWGAVVSFDDGARLYTWPKPRGFGR